MTDENLFDGISGLKQSESDIRHIFHRYINTLFTTKWNIANAITEWSKTVINQVQEHATQQKNLVEEEYTKKVNRLNEIRDRVVEQILIYEQKKDTEQINQLLNKCNTLKVELATLVYINRPVASIQLITEEQLTQQNTDECNANKTDDEETPKKLIEDQDSTTPNNTDTNETSSSKVSSTNAESIDSSSSVTKTTNKDDQSIDSHDRLETHIYSCNSSTEKCPICFMIFPSSMTVHYRNLHVNEHYRDDW